MPAFTSTMLSELLMLLENVRFYSEELGRDLLKLGAIDGLPAVRKLRTCLNTTLKNFFLLLSKLIGSLDSTVGVEWSTFTGMHGKRKVSNVPDQSAFLCGC